MGEVHGARAADDLLLARRPAQADESLATLLARRAHVRTTQTALATEARPELFKPVQTVVLPSRPGTSEEPDLKLDISEPEKPAAGAGQKPESTTSRLLDAKRKGAAKEGLIGKR